MSNRKLFSEKYKSVIFVAIHRGERDCIEGGNPRPGLRSKDLRLNISHKG
jgi:hypothetical protein